MENVGLISYMYSEDFYCWGLVWVEQATDLISEEMVMGVVDFDVVDFEDFEEKNVGMVDRMVDTDSIESIFHRDFVLLVPKLEIDFEIGAKVAAKNSNLVEVNYTIDHGILVFEVLAKAF